MEELVGLGCQADTLWAIAEGLTHFGPTGGAPDWLVSGVWLCAGGKQYIVTASVEVLPDGYVARSLIIRSPGALVAEIESNLPDVSARLFGRGSTIDLGEIPALPSAPRSLTAWPTGHYSASVLVRVAQRASTINRVACALLFISDSGHSLLVGADPMTLALVMSEDQVLIEDYRSGCETLTVIEYLELCSR